MAATWQVLTTLLFTLVSVTRCDDGVTRELNVTSEWRTSCLAQLNDAAACDAHPVAHVRAAAAGDTLHLLVALWAAPALLLLRTPAHGEVSLNWTLLTSDTPEGGVVADGVTAAYGVSLEQLIEFDDPSDSADLGRAAAVSLRPLALAVAPPEVSAAAARVAVSLTAPPANDTANDWSATGSVTVKMEVLNTDRRTDELPHLQQTGTSAVVGLVLDKLSTNSNFSHTRFGVQVATVSDETQKLEETKSLDDEYTPGVFKLVSLSSPSPDSGFLQWRPVAYTARESSIEHSTTARHYTLDSSDSGLPDSPLLRAYFDQGTPSQRLNVTFGLSEDGWYKDSQFAAWELTAGLGAPPSDQFSLMVILLLGIGLGLPTVALIGGGIWMAVRRIRGPARGGRLITEDE